MASVCKICKREIINEFVHIGASGYTYHKHCIEWLADLTMKTTNKKKIANKIKRRRLECLAG